MVTVINTVSNISLKKIFLVMYSISMLIVLVLTSIFMNVQYQWKSWMCESIVQKTL